jgi:tetratricopeptide (TPR) repeat protein
LDSLNSDIRYKIGKSYFDLSKKTQKIEHINNSIYHLEKAIIIDEKNYSSLSLLGEIFLAFRGLDEKKFIQSISYFKKSLAINYYQENTHLLMGYAYKHLKNNDLAIKFFSNAININPNTPEFWNNCGNTLAGIGDFDEAAKSYERAIDLQPNNGKSYRQLALIKSYKLTEKQIAGMQHLYDSSSLSGEDLSNLCFALAEVNDKMGEWKKAFDFYQEGNSIRLTEIKSFFPFTHFIIHLG